MKKRAATKAVSHKKQSAVPAPGPKPQASLYGPVTLLAASLVSAGLLMFVAIRMAHPPDATPQAAEQTYTPDPLPEPRSYDADTAVPPPPEPTPELIP